MKRTMKTTLKTSLIALLVLCSMMLWNRLNAEEFVDGVNTTDSIAAITSGSISGSTTIGTTGIITGLVSTTVQTAEYTMTTAMQSGGAVLMTTAHDVNLLAAAVGNSFKVTVRDVSETVSIRPYTGDTLVLDRKSVV